MKFESSQRSPTFWFVNTDKKSFLQSSIPRRYDNPFDYWLEDARLYVTPSNKPLFTDYQVNLERIKSGDYVFAFESGFGYVGVGRVKAEKELLTRAGGTELHPSDPVVRSVAVEWDSSITRTTRDTYTKHYLGTLTEIGYDSKKYRDAQELSARFEHNKFEVISQPSELQVFRRIMAEASLDSYTREQLIQARVGQGLFRKSLLQREPRCRVTGIVDPVHLVASHIKPWAACMAQEHIDPDNGLMLAPHIDHLFDSGYISFEDDGTLLRATTLNPAILECWNLPMFLNVGSFTEGQSKYLAYHRREVFNQTHPRCQRNLVGDCTMSLRPVISTTH